MNPVYTTRPAPGKKSLKKIPPRAPHPFARPLALLEEMLLEVISTDEEIPHELAGHVTDLHLECFALARKTFGITEVLN